MIALTWLLLLPCVQVRHQEQLLEARHQLELERQTAVRREKDIAEAALGELEQTKQVHYFMLLH